MNRPLLCSALLGILALPGIAWAGDTPAEPHDEAAEEAKSDDAEEAKDDDAEEAKSATESPRATERANTDKPILLTGEDPELTAAVAAELRAAGFEVTLVPPGGSPDLSDDELPTMIEVHQQGELVIVQLDEIVKVPPGADDGMAGTDAAALRAAETIRLLVAARAKGNASRSRPAKKRAPKVDTDAGAERVPSITVALSPDMEGDSEVPVAAEFPLLRLGIHAGAGVLTFPESYYVFGDGGDFHGHNDLTAQPAWAVGISAGGNLTPDVNITGRVTFASTETDDELTNTWIVRPTLLALWEPLGADNTWTPVLGGGIFGEVMSMAHMDFSETSFCFDDHCPNYDFFDDSILFNSGLAANVGISVAQPWRFRFDVQGNVTLLSLGADQPFRAMPSVVGTLGLEYDVITTKPAVQVAKR